MEIFLSLPAGRGEILVKHSKPPGSDFRVADLKVPLEMDIHIYSQRVRIQRRKRLEAATCEVLVPISTVYRVVETRDGNSVTASETNVRRMTSHVRGSAIR